MNSLTTRQKKALETREKLLKTSLDLFNKHGFEHVSVEQITKACNVSKGTFYTHFPSKYDVILEKFKELDNFYSTVEKSIDGNMPASEKNTIALQRTNAVFNKHRWQGFIAYCIYGCNDQSSGKRSLFN